MAIAGLHGAIEQVRRLAGWPSPVWKPRHPWTRLTAQRGAEAVRQLRTDGITFWPGFLPAAQVARVRQDLDAALTEPLAPGVDYRADQLYFASTQPLALSPVFAEAALDPDLLNIVSGYMRRTPFLSEADFRRVLPLDLAEHERVNAKFAKGHSSSHWHHDMHGREVKVMIYLTDVAEGDQNFAYMTGSHGGFRSTNYEKSRFNDAQVAAMGKPILECYGTAGTAVIFDTNGIHRLRRFKTRLRDSVTFNYHPGRMCQIVPQRIHAEALAARRQELARLLEIAAPEKS